MTPQAATPLALLQNIVVDTDNDAALAPNAISAIIRAVVSSSGNDTLKQDASAQQQLRSALAALPAQDIASSFCPVEGCPIINATLLVSGILGAVGLSPWTHHKEITV